MNTESSWTTVDFNPADINGDGLMDLVWTETNRKKHRIRYALAEEDMTTGQRQLKAATFTTLASCLEYDEDYDKNLRVHTDIIDYNGDGRMDVVVYGEDRRTSEVYVSTPQDNGGWRLDGSCTPLFTARYRYADLNADGLLDAYRLVENAGEEQDGVVVPASYDLEVRYLKAASTAEATSSTYYAYGEAQAYAIAFTPTRTSVGDAVFWPSLDEAELALADFNGDGRADLVALGNDNTNRPIALLPNTEKRRFTIPSLKRLEVFVQTDTTTDGVLGIHKLSASVTHNVSGFIMTSFRRHDEADSVVTGDKANALRRSLFRLDRAAINAGRCGTVTGRVCPDLPALHRPV